MTSTAYANFIPREDNIWGSITERESKLLKVVYLQNLRNIPVMVMDLMKSPAFGSPATVHACIKELLRKKLIVYVVSKQDHRKKMLHLSPKGKTLFQRLNTAMNESINQ